MSNDNKKVKAAEGRTSRRARSAGAERGRVALPWGRLDLSRLPLFEAGPAGRRLRVLVVVCASFFLLWLTLTVFSQAALWPLLIAPILLSAWFFYEAGAIATALVSGVLLAQVSIDRPAPVLLALTVFVLLGLGLGWGQRRQKVAYRRALRSSLTDPLTGLYNYGYLMGALDRELHRVNRYGGTVTLIMMDIDHFKLFNDRYGHQAGNEALKALGAVLRREKRESDIAARFGGEEFALLIPADEDSGLETGDRLRQAIARIQVPVGRGQAAGMTVSIGVASYPGSATSKEELLDRADQLLYTSKRNGRNQVSVAPERRRLAVM
ncbi:MAG: GGDEF domain-containing protein [Gaiellales bacterium]|nr:MAG: GGDEF domain-containing protein [Gaiellales bacterium]